MKTAVFTHKEGKMSARRNVSDQSWTPGVCLVAFVALVIIGFGLFSQPRIAKAQAEPETVGEMTTQELVDLIVKTVIEVLDAREAAPSAAPASGDSSGQGGYTGPTYGGTMLAQPRGPWAPNADGSGNNFEVTCNETNCAVVKLQVWFPHGNTPWGQDEVHVVVDAGLSIEVLNGAGAAWEYPLGFPQAEFAKQFADDSARRGTDTKYGGIKTVEDLVAAKLVVIRFDRRAGAKVSITVDPAEAASATVVEVTECRAVGAGNADDETVVVPAGHAYNVEVWKPESLKGNRIYGPGMTIQGVYGAIWDYPCGVEGVIADLDAAGKEYTVVD